MKKIISISHNIFNTKACLASLLLLFALSSCVSLKPYERIYINDPEMQMGTDPGHQFTKYVHSIREGATPPDAGKASGGCGCN